MTPRRTARTKALQAARKLPGVVRVWVRGGVICTERYPFVLPEAATFNVLHTFGEYAAERDPSENEIEIKIVLLGKYEGPIDAPGGHPGEKW